jgi:hypothetical protein
MLAPIPCAAPVTTATLFINFSKNKYPLIPFVVIKNISNQSYGYHPKRF